MRPCKELQGSFYTGLFTFSTFLLADSGYNTNTKTYVAALYHYAGVEDQECSLRLYTLEGKLVKERKLGIFNKPLSNSSLLSLDITKRNRLYLVYGNGEIEELDSNLATIGRHKVPGVYAGLLEQREGMIDVDGDGINELLFRGEKGGEIIITRNDFSHPVLINLQEDGAGQYTTILNGKQAPFLFFTGKNNAFVFRYYPNILYGYRWSLYLGIYGLILLMVFLARKYYTAFRQANKNMIVETANLTRREQEIVRLLAEGKTSQQIAGELYISKNTVDTHRRNMLERTGCKSTTELVSRLKITMDTVPGRPPVY